MFLLLSATKDAYITNKVISGRRMTSSNVGGAGSLDMFKLYGETYSGSSPNVEISRALIGFDVTPLADLVRDRKVDPSDASFSCTLRMRDVYGGQTTPENFTLIVDPLSGSFDEGIGRDVVFFSDGGTCNFLSSSRHRAWHVEGAGLGGHATSSVDFISSATIAGSVVPMRRSQTFVDGTEDLIVDVTQSVSAVLAGIIPRCDYRISFDESYEADDSTYFVKRFASRTAFDTSKRPRIEVRFDDSQLDDSGALIFDVAGDVFLRNVVRERLTNAVFSGSSVTGSNCIVLRMSTDSVSGSYSLSFTGSQYSRGLIEAVGIYTASVLIPSNDSIIGEKIRNSGSVTFETRWTSPDGSVTHAVGENMTVRLPWQSSLSSGQRYIVSVTGVRSKFSFGDVIVGRVTLFDEERVGAMRMKSQVRPPSAVLRDVHVRVRDPHTNEVFIPFDTDKNSTRTSSDSRGHYFSIDSDAIPRGRTCVIDVLISTGERTEVHEAASCDFTVN